MHEQPASVVAQIGTTLLSSHKVLALVRHTPFHQSLNSRELREAVYLAYLPWSSRLPDHVFENGWKLLLQHSPSKERPSLLLGALQAMADEFLESRHGRLYVRQKKFGAWQQSVVSRVSGLPLQATALLLMQPNAWRAATGETHWSWEALPNWASRHLPVVSPYDPLVEDYLGREGLHETHLHLNGSTHAENCWLRALRAPKQETKDFSIKWHNHNKADAAGVRELARAIDPGLSPAELHRQLVVAGRLRRWLVSAATDNLRPNVNLPFNFTELAGDEDQQKQAPDPAEERLILTAKSCTVDELRWMRQLLHRLKDRPNIALERMLHAYLILQNQYYRLLVQSEEQFGFDQFQKLTYTELREPAEADYLPRFWAMHGRQAGASRTNYLEGRFSPKNTLRKNYKLLKAILGGYWQYLHNHDPHDHSSGLAPRKLGALLEQLEMTFREKSPLDRSHHRLALVVHFIKKPWGPGIMSGPYRFYKQREELELTTNVLLESLNRWPRLRTWVRGVDAASNEMHAPPEVFATCYRVCQRAGLTHRTYHAGEDFAHLLSGLRTMYDALEFLDLRDGDRIGHGTAMGLSPRLWLERTPGQLVVKKGDWMLDLLAAWRLLRTLPEATAVASRVADDLAKCAGDVFHRNISCTSLEAAMGLRYLNVRYVQAALETDWSTAINPLCDIWQAEAHSVLAVKKQNPQHLQLLWEWLSDKKLWQRSEALVSVDAAYFDEATYLHLQQALMREVSRRNVVIETLPSSNVRISHYHSFSEHHALRWMRVPGFVQEGDPEIMVSLGSDDPGIFAGDLNGEFYQLYGALRNQGVSDQAALALLAPVNERGRAYRFHDPFLG